MNVKVISTNVGRALLVSALFMFISMLISIGDGMDSAFAPLSISFIITFITGAFPFIFVRKSEAISLQDGFMIIVLSWILSFLFGMLPYVMWGGEFSLVNALFESVSGYTTTGSTILTNVEGLPRSLIFWRSSTHFIGGLGVVVFLLLIMPNASPFRLRLTNIELSSLSREGYRTRSVKTVYITALVYVGLVLVETLMLMLAGMSFFDAVNHSFSTVATGGFSTRNASISYYDSTAINLIVMFFMVVSSLHFGMLFMVFSTRSVKPLKNPVVKFFLWSIVIMTVLVTLSLKFQGGYTSWGKALMDASFQVCSYVTTTGFGSVDNREWPLFSLLVLAYALFQCGCSGSTAGGVKADRMYIAVKAMVCQIRKRLHPSSSVVQIRLGNHLVEDDVALPVILYIVLYSALIAVSIILLVLCGVAPVEAFSGALSSMANAGAAMGDLSSLGSYAGQPAVAKLIYSLDMFLGRVEIYPLFVIMYLLFKRGK